MSLSSTMGRAAALVVAGALLGLSANAARPHGVSIRGFAAPTQCSGAEGHAANDDVSPAEASGWCGRSDVVIADARSAAAFAEGHVAGAVHLPCDANGQAAVEALTHFDRAQRIVVYGLGSEDARPVADSLKRRHPAVRVQVLAGGFPAWAGAGLACASGPCAECVTPQSSQSAPSSGASRR